MLRATLVQHDRPRASLGQAALHQRASPRAQIWLAALMIFLLAATNGTPMWWSSGIFVAVLAPALFAAQGINRVANAAMARGHVRITLCLFAFFMANLASALASPTLESMMALVMRCVLPILVFLSLSGLVLRIRDVRLLVLSLAAGSSWLFVSGLLAYYREWGIPDLQTMLWSRYNVERMAGYSEATLGNVGRMGGYVTLVLPPLLLAALAWVRSAFGRSILGMAFMLGAANLIVSGSRTGLVMLVLAAAAIILSFGLRRAMTVVICGLALALVTMSSWIEIIADPDVVKRYMPSLVSGGGFDNSADERLHSIEIGWAIFIEHPIFGVGPGMSPHFNYFAVPHQSIVHQLSEIGLLGGLAFAWLNVTIIWRAMSAGWSASSSPFAAHSFLWLVGPSFWLIFGLVGGITFNAGMALSWMGIAVASLALSGTRVVDLKS